MNEHWTSKHWHCDETLDIVIPHLICFDLQLRASQQVFPRLPGLIFVVPRYWSQLDAGPVRALRLLCSNFEIIWRYLNFSNLYFPKPRLCQIYGYDKSNNLFPLWYQQLWDNSVHHLGRKIVIMISPDKSPREKNKCKVQKIVTNTFNSILSKY